MLQQTRVEAMLPRYRAFVARFPDPAALAAADEDAVLAMWSGLGYYRRARALHRAARCLSDHGGRIPQTAAALKALPGVGDYTAAAVASIAFGEPVAVVDGNVRRVLARLFATPGIPGRAAFERRIQKGADDLMAGAADPGVWNQALMELGALVCLPKRPRCGACPVAGDCRAHAAGREAEFPQRAPRPAVEAVATTRGVVRDPERGLLVVRRSESPLRGLLDFPGGPRRTGEPPATALMREALRRYRLELVPGRALRPFPHQIMNRKITVFAFEAALAGASLDRLPEGARWVRPDHASGIAAGAIVTKVLRLLPEPGTAYTARRIP